MPFRLLKKGKYIFSSAFPKVLEVHTSTPSKTRSFCVNFTQNPRAKYQLVRIVFAMKIVVSHS